MSEKKDGTTRTRIKPIPLGTKFGRLTVIAYFGLVGESHAWKCVCECGNETITKGAQLRYKRGVRSCGCLKNDALIQRSTKHGICYTPEYEAWYSMKKRCYGNGTSDSEYKRRGTIVCDRWLNSMQDFIADVGPRPTPRHSIDRINNEGNYEPGNVRWATPEQQNRNKKNNIVIVHNGLSMTIPEWSEQVGIARSTLYSRFYKGLPADEVLECRSQ